MYKFAYLFGAMLFMIYWSAIFAKLKEMRRPMIFFSLLYGVIGVVFGFVYTADWWRPETITGTRVGVEDFLLGFSNGGIGFALPYLKVFSGPTPKASGVGPLKTRVVDVMIFLVLTALITLFIFHFLKINSFYANAIGLFASLLFVYCKRKDLVKTSLLSGSMMLVLSLPVYYLTILFFPEWIERSWMIEKLSGVMLIGVPIEDFIWYFLVGAAVSVIYPLYIGNHSPLSFPAGANAEGKGIHG